LTRRVGLASSGVHLRQGSGGQVQGPTRAAVDL
jgi:hypothetical protein